MRDPLLERDNAYLAANRRAGDAAREEAQTLIEAQNVVSENWQMVPTGTVWHGRSCTP